MPIKYVKTNRLNNFIKAVIWSIVLWIIILTPIIAFAGEKRDFPLRPAGHVIFCHYQPTECSASQPARIALDEKMMKTVEQVNTKANARRYRAEKLDVWDNGNDCEDYAIRKRRSLRQAGIPDGAMRYAQGKVRGELHVVLIVRTEGGDMILDNLTSKILPRKQSAVRLESMETADPTVWTKI